MADHVPVIVVVSPTNAVRRIPVTSWDVSRCLPLLSKHATDINGCPPLCRRCPTVLSGCERMAHETCRRCLPHPSSGTSGHVPMQLPMRMCAPLWRGPLVDSSRCIASGARWRLPCDGRRGAKDSRSCLQETHLASAG